MEYFTQRSPDFRKRLKTFIWQHKPFWISFNPKTKLGQKNWLEWSAFREDLSKILLSLYNLFKPFLEAPTRKITRCPMSFYSRKEHHKIAWLKILLAKMKQNTIQFVTNFLSCQKAKIHKQNKDPMNQPMYLFNEKLEKKSYTFFGKTKIHFYTRLKKFQWMNDWLMRLLLEEGDSCSGRVYNKN